MAGNLTGLDFEALANLELRTTQQINQLTNLHSNRSIFAPELNRIWIGPSASQFISRWQRSESVALRRLITSLEHMRHELRINIDQQARASEANDVIRNRHARASFTPPPPRAWSQSSKTEVPGSWINSRSFLDSVDNVLNPVKGLSDSIGLVDAVTSLSPYLEYLTQGAGTTGAEIARDKILSGSGGILPGAVGKAVGGLGLYFSAREAQKNVEKYGFWDIRSTESLLNASAGSIALASGKLGQFGAAFGLGLTLGKPIAAGTDYVLEKTTGETSGGLLYNFVTRDFNEIMTPEQMEINEKLGSYDLRESVPAFGKQLAKSVKGVVVDTAKSSAKNIVTLPNRAWNSVTNIFK